MCMYLCLNVPQCVRVCVTIISMEETALDKLHFTFRSIERHCRWLLADDLGAESSSHCHVNQVRSAIYCGNSTSSDLELQVHGVKSLEVFPILAGQWLNYVWGYSCWITAVWGPPVLYSSYSSCVPQGQPFIIIINIMKSMCMCMCVYTCICVMGSWGNTWIICMVAILMYFHLLWFHSLGWWGCKTWYTPFPIHHVARLRCAELRLRHTTVDTRSEGKSSNAACKISAHWALTATRSPDHCAL